MVAQSSNTSAVGQLLHEAEQLRPGEFEQFVVRILALNASRKSNGLAPEESLLLKNINKEFVPKKMERFLLLDEKRRQEVLTAKEHSELLALVRQLEKYDAQKLQWIGQLALLRKVPFDSLMKQLGLYPVVPSLQRAQVHQAGGFRPIDSKSCTAFQSPYSNLGRPFYLGRNTHPDSGPFANGACNCQMPENESG